MHQGAWEEYLVWFDEQARMQEAAEEADRNPQTRMREEAEEMAEEAKHELMEEAEEAEEMAEEAAPIYDDYDDEYTRENMSPEGMGSDEIDWESQDYE